MFMNKNCDRNRDKDNKRLSFLLISYFLLLLHEFWFTIKNRHSNKFLLGINL